MRKSVMSPCNHGMRPMLRALVGFIIWAGASATHERLVLPEDLPAYTLFNQAVELQARSLDTEALQVYQAAVDLKPDLCEAYLNAGTIVHRMGQVEQARRLYEEAFRTADMARLRSHALNNLAHLRYVEAGSDYGVLQETVEQYQRAIGFDETNVDAWYNLGKSLEDLGLREQALEAFTRVLQIDPAHPGAHLNIGNYYLLKGEGLVAVAHHEQVVNSSRAGSREVRSALNNMGQMYRIKHMHAEAKAAFERSVALDPEDAMGWSNLMVAKRSLCEWQGLEQLQERIVHRLAHDLSHPETWPKGGQRSLTPYDSTLLSTLSPALHLNLTRAYLAGLQHISRCVLLPSPPPSPLRITYLSYDFRDHPMGHLTQGIVTSHTAGRVVVQAASYGPADNSTYRRRIASGVDRFDDMEGEGELQAACHRIAESFGPHIVVDLMGLTRGTRTGLAALRPGPIVVNYLGYPGTMGSAFTDYIFADRTVAPPETAALGFSERLAVLPYTYQANDYSPSLPLAPLGNSSGGGRLVLCNFNHVDKFEPTSFSLWMAVLRSLPSSELHLLRPSDSMAEPVTRHLLLEAAALGVHPSRIVFLPRVAKDRHVARLASTCHLFLDTLTYGAHSTASDSLFAAVPLLTLQGWGGRGGLGAFPSRVGASLLNGLGRSETVAVSLKDMEDLARRLGQPDARRGAGSSTNALRDGIARALAASLMHSAVFSVPAMTRVLERGYEAMWEVHELGLPPQHLLVAGEPGGLAAVQAESQAAAIDLLLSHLQEGRAEPALHVADRQLAASPEHADAWHLRGLALMQLGRLPEALSSIDQALHLTPGVSFYHQNRAEVLVLMGRAAEAQLDLYRSLRLAPDELAAAVRLLGLLHDSQAWHEAQAVWARIEPWVGRPGSQHDPQLLSRFYQLHAISLAQTGSFAEAVTVLRATVTRFPRDHQAAMRLATALEAAGMADEAIEQFSHAVRLKNEVEFQHIPPRPRSGLPRVAIYCDEYGQSWWGEWGPSSLGRGLGGSEEAVVFIARELARSGRYHVEVYGSPPRHEWGDDGQGVHWYPSQAYDTRDAADIFVAWRYHISLALSIGSRRRYLWLQDLPSTATYTPSFFSGVSRIFCLSSFHATYLPAHLRPLALVTPNGIDPAFLVDGPNLPHRFVYGSAPNRGLEPLLRLWPQIRSRLRTGEAAAPELWVFYGFSEAFIKYGRRTMPNFDSWMESMQTMLQQEGVRYIGMVDHARLAEGYASAGFMLYPTIFPETGCVTLMKAMALGAIPITSRLRNSTLPELTGHYDLGPSRALRSGERWWEDEEWMREYVDAVVSAANEEAEERREGREGRVGAMRREMRAWARDRFLWAHVARLWTDSFEDKPQAGQDQPAGGRAEAAPP